MINQPLKNDAINSANSANSAVEDSTGRVESSDPRELSTSVIRLQSLLNFIIENNIKGKSDTLIAASKYDIKNSYSSIQSKLNLYKSKGAASLTRKSKSDKGTARSFSNESLLKLQEIFCDKIHGGCAIRAYEDLHKYFRKISSEFSVASTGEVLDIVNGYLCDVKNHSILSSYTTKFVPGTYEIKPEFINQLPVPKNQLSIINYQLSIGSYASASRFLKEIKNNSADALFLNRFGIYDYRNKRQHTMKLDYSKLQPAELIVGDGKKLDVLVISHDWKKVYRPYLMGWYDAATRRYCYQVSFTETSEAIANSLAVAIDQWGLPQICKHDNGKSYLSGRFAQMKENLNIKTTLATVKLARAKSIESFHNVLDNLLKTQIGYTGNKYQEFPDDTRNRLKFVLGQQRDITRTEKLFKEEQDWDCNIINIANPEGRLKSSKKRFMHITELIQLLDEKLQEYHERIHGGLKIDSVGKLAYDINCKDEVVNTLGETVNSPNGRYEYKIRQGFKPVRCNPESVGIYAMNFELRTVQLKTGINLNGKEFYSPKLRPVAGERVIIRYTNINTNQLYIFHSDELQKINDKKYLTPDIIRNLKFICIAELQRAIHYNDSSFKDELLLQRAEERQLKSTFNTATVERSLQNPDSSGLLALTATATATATINELSILDSQIKNIKQEELEIKINNLPKLKKIKGLHDDD